MTDNNHEHNLRHTYVIMDEIDRVAEEMKQSAPTLPKNGTNIKRGFDEWIIDDPEFIRLRLDWEIKNDHDRGWEQNVEIARDMIIADLVWASEKGDTDSDHGMLKVVDGREKHGKELESIEVGEWFSFAEPMWRKESTEYTTYMSVKFNWKESK